MKTTSTHDEDSTIDEKSTSENSQDLVEKKSEKASSAYGGLSQESSQDTIEDQIENKSPDHEVPSPENLEDLIKNQTDDIEVLSQLFKEQHEEHIRQQASQGPYDLSREVNDRLLIRLANQNQMDESLTQLREQIALLEQEGEERGNDASGHSGQWRCSVMTCDVEQSDHDYTQPFEDGNRHIFCWDCCLSDERESQTCDMDFFDFDD